MFFQVLKLKTGMPEYSDFVHFSAAAVESDLWGPGRPYTDSEPSKNGGSKITDVNFASCRDAGSSLFFYLRTCKYLENMKPSWFSSSLGPHQSPMQNRPLFHMLSSKIAYHWKLKRNRPILNHYGTTQYIPCYLPYFLAHYYH